MKTKANILIYGAGKCGQIFAYEFVKEHNVYVYDIDKKRVEQLVVNLKLIGNIEKHKEYMNYDLIILTASTKECKAKASAIYIFANPVFELYKHYRYQYNVVIPCGASLNKARLRAMGLYDEACKLSGIHNFEYPAYLLVKANEYLKLQKEVGYLCEPAVYYATKEIKEVLKWI